MRPSMVSGSELMLKETRFLAGGVAGLDEPLGELFFLTTTPPCSKLLELQCQPLCATVAITKPELIDV